MDARKKVLAFSFAVIAAALLLLVRYQPTMRRAVAADTILTYGDVVLDDTSNAFSLRRETETRVTG